MTLLLTTALLGMALAAAGVWMVHKQLNEIAIRTTQVEASAYYGPTHMPGTRFPDFRLRQADGVWRTRADFPGDYLVAIHWDAQCEFCKSMESQLREIENEARPADIAVVRFSRHLAANSLVVTNHLLCPRDEAAFLFAGLGTPSAYLLDREGYVLRPPARGRDMVLDLIDEGIVAAATRGA